MKKVAYHLTWRFIIAARVSEPQGGCRLVDVDNVGADPAGPDLVQPQPHRGGDGGPGEGVRPAGGDSEAALWHLASLPSQSSTADCLVQGPDPGSHLQVLLSFQWGEI